MYTHVLIPTDGSELASKAVEHGVALAKRIGAKATMLTVCRPLMCSRPTRRCWKIHALSTKHACRSMLRNSCRRRPRSADARRRMRVGPRRA